jgi:hypothetical protein
MLVPVLVFAIILAACAVVAGRALVRMGSQLSRTGGELERLGDRMEQRFLPRAEATMEQTTAAVRELEEVAEIAATVPVHLQEALASLGDLTLMVEEAVRPIGETAASLGVDRPRVRAIRAACGAFLGRLFRRRG